MWVIGLAVTWRGVAFVGELSVQEVICVWGVLAGSALGDTHSTLRLKISYSYIIVIIYMLTL